MLLWETVITKDVPDSVAVAGVLAKVVRDYFEFLKKRRVGVEKVRVGYRSKTIIKPSMRSVSLKKLLFFCGIFLWIIQEYIIRTKYIDFLGYAPCKILRIIALILFFSKIVLFDTKYSLRLLWFLIVGFVIATISRFSSNAESSNTVLNVFILCMAARNIDFTEICSFNFWVSGSAWAFTVLSTYLGIVDKGFIRELMRTRYYLGFDYVSFPSIYLINIIFSGFYAYTKKKENSVPWALIIVAAMLNLWVYLKTVTRLPFVIVTLFLVFYVLCEKLKINVLKNNRIVTFLMTLLFPIAGILTYVLSNMYDVSNVKWIALNELVNNRLLMNKMGLERFGLTLFGQTIVSNTDMKSGEYFFIDSGYMNLLLRNGIVVFVLILVLYTFLLRNSIKMQNRVLAIWLICVCIYSIVNGILLSPVTNCSLFAIWQIREDIMEFKVKIANQIKSGEALN